MRPPPVSTQSIVKAGGDQVSCRVEDGVVLLQTKDGVYFGLNELGARLWESIQEPRPVTELANLVSERYEVDRERATADVLALVRELVDNRLIEVVNRAEQ
jgi:coenzyme PQQ synthesis protein D (PqqD)